MNKVNEAYDETGIFRYLFSHKLPQEVAAAVQQFRFRYISLGDSSFVYYFLTLRYRLAIFGLRENGC